MYIPQSFERNCYNQGNEIGLRKPDYYCIRYYESRDDKKDVIYRVKAERCDKE